MLKPVKMVKISVAGPKEYLATVSDILHRVNAVHIEDPTEEEYFKLGEPLEKASTISRSLVLLRSYISHLKIDPEKVIPTRKFKASEVEKEIQNKLEEFQKEIGTRIEKLRELNERIKALEEEMYALSGELRFEKAAKKRDEIKKLREILVFFQ